MMTGIRVRDLTVEFPSGGYLLRPLDGFAMDAGTGELVALLGPSGSGKTTLLSCLAGILRPTRGRIEVDGIEVATLEGKALDEYRRRKVGVVFQAFNLIAGLNARDNVAVPLRLAGYSQRQARARAEALLDEVGLSDRLRHLPRQLSGGQQQRVAIARALALEPGVILADEPTAHLDHVQVEGVLRLLRTIASPGRVVVIATHDDRMTPLADRCVNMVPDANGDEVDGSDVTLAPGETLFEQGSRGHLVYIVASGEIVLSRVRADRSEEVVRTVGPGGYFGELGPMLGLPRSATARAASPARLQALTVRSFRGRQPSLAREGAPAATDDGGDGMS
jgi:putative ABC transport system ATP-binding protein